jgi:hypothetical protein
VSNYDSLVDRNEIAHLLDVGPTAVSNYVARTNDKHPPFPEPVITRSLGRFRLWDIEDVARWHEAAFPKRSGAFDNAIQRLRAVRT